MDKYNIYGVIRLDCDEEHEEDEKLIQEIDDYEFSDEQTKEFEKKLVELKNKGELGHTQYIGNAYYIETTTIDNINELVALLASKIQDFPKGSVISLELNYHPEWAEEEE